MSIKKGMRFENLGCGAAERIDEGVGRHAVRSGKGHRHAPEQRERMALTEKGAEYQEPLAVGGLFRRGHRFSHRTQKLLIIRNIRRGARICAPPVSYI